MSVIAKHTPRTGVPSLVDLPEIRRMIEAAGCGKLLSDDSPEGIATCLAGLDAARIDACKRAALARAQDLNFEAEGGKLLALVTSLAPAGTPSL